MKPLATPLSAIEARVLGVLVEKERTVPDTYPLSLNSVVTGCNQKNAREPLMNVAEADAQAALDALRARHLVVESSGARVTRYTHNLARALRVPSQAEALMAVLLLRGPQTAGELRINAERLHRFADIGSVEVFLEELATRPEADGGALVVRLARAPGSREARWAHLLSGPVDTAVSEAPATASAAGQAAPATWAANPDPSAAEFAALREELSAQRGQLDELRAAVSRLSAEVESLRASGTPSG